MEVGPGGFASSAPTAFVRACLAPVLPRLLAKHPEIRVDIRSSDSMTDLADEGVDLALRTGRIDGIPGHVSQTLMTFPWTACATPAYLAGREMPSSPADLADHELIGFRNSGTGRLEAWRFRSTVRGSEDATARHEPDARMIFDDALTAWDMARNSHGIAWAPAWLALDDLRRGRVGRSAEGVAMRGDAAVDGPPRAAPDTKADKDGDRLPCRRRQ